MFYGVCFYVVFAMCRYTLVRLLTNALRCRYSILIDMCMTPVYNCRSHDQDYLSNMCMYISNKRRINVLSAP